ncbi:MAG: FG-GAP-like repeat-containing protein [Pirellulales bacterium]
MRTSRENREHARRNAPWARRCRRLLGGERLESRLALATDFAAVPLWNGEATFPEAFDNGQVNTQSPGMLLNLLGGPAFANGTNTQLSWTGLATEVHAGRGAYRVGLSGVSEAAPGEFAVVLATPGPQGRNVRDLTPYVELEFWTRNDASTDLIFRLEVRDADFRRAERDVTLAAHAGWQRHVFSLTFDEAHGWEVPGELPDLTRAREFSFHARAAEPVTGVVLVDDLTLREAGWSAQPNTNEVLRRLAERQFRALWGTRDRETGLVPVNSAYDDLMGLNTSAALVRLSQMAVQAGWVSAADVRTHVTHLVTTLESEFAAGYTHLPPRILNRYQRGPGAVAEPEESPIDAALVYLALQETRAALPADDPLALQIDSLLARFDFFPFWNGTGWRLNYVPGHGFSDQTYSGYSTEVYLISLAAGLAGDVPIEDTFRQGIDVTSGPLTDATSGYLMHSQPAFRAPFTQWLFSLWVDVEQRGDIAIPGAEFYRAPNPLWNAERFAADLRAWLEQENRIAPRDAADNGMGGHGIRSALGPHGAAGTETYHQYSPWLAQGEPDLVMPWSLWFDRQEVEAPNQRVETLFAQGLAGPFGLADSAIWLAGADSPTRWNGRADLWNVSLATLALLQSSGNSPQVDQQLDRVFSFDQHYAMRLDGWDVAQGGDGGDGMVLRGSDAGISRYFTLGQLGAQVELVGDGDGDGFDDLFVAAPASHGGGGNGQGIVVYGGAGRATLTVDQRNPGRSSIILGTRPILAGSAAGDPFLDPTDSLAFGFQFTANSFPAVSQITRSIGQRLPDVWPTSGDNRIPTQQILGDDALGSVVSLQRGDLNGDAYHDLVVVTSTGRTFLLLGQSDNTATTRNLDSGAPGVVEVTPGGTTPWFTSPVAAVGDWNFDGIQDLALAGRRTAGESPDLPAAVLVYGRSDWSDWNSNQPTFDGVQATLIVGSSASIESLAASPNRTLSQVDDLVLGMPRATVLGRAQAGLMQLVSPASAGGTIDLRTYGALSARAGTTAGQRLGQDVSGIGDFNGDGLPDIAISSPGRGQVDVLLDLTSGSLPSPDQPSFVLANAGSGFGTLSHRPGDLNGDGLMDFAIGAPSYGGTGAVFVVYGREVGTVLTHRSPGVGLLKGTPENVRGAFGNEQLVGSAGRDTLIGHGGNDRYSGGASDDIIQVKPVGTFRVAGGSGHDTLVLEGRQQVLAWRPSENGQWIADVEEFDIRGSGPNLLKIGAPTFVRRMLPDDPTLRVRRGEDDRVALDLQWVRVGTRSEAGVTYDEYSVDAATLLVEQVAARDFGDAYSPVFPGSDIYGTELLSDGARHVLTGPRLGTLADAEEDGQFAPDSLGDDVADDGQFPPAPSDEDGVSFPFPLVVDAGVGAALPVRVILSNATSARLDAWVDFNGDGDWLDVGEQVFQSTLLSAGANDLVLQVPPAVTRQPTLARFRVSTAGGLSFLGLAADGEVEDYSLTFLSPSAAVVSDVRPEQGGDGSQGTVVKMAPIELGGATVVGDFNGDGWDDLAITDGNYVNADQTQSGRVYLVLGRPEGWPASLDVVAHPEQASLVIDGPSQPGQGRIAFTMAGGDFNGDGLADIVTYGDVAMSSSPGVGYIVLGRRDLPSRIALDDLRPDHGGKGDQGVWLTLTSPSLAFVTQLHFLGDLNGDGCDEIGVIAGLIGEAAQPAVLWGRVAPGPVIDLLPLLAPPGDARLGFQVKTEPCIADWSTELAGIGDVNADGLGDFAVVEVCQGASTGSVRRTAVVFGRASGFGTSFALSQLEPAAGGTGEAGFIVLADLANEPRWVDVNHGGIDWSGDGIDDLVLLSDQGRAYVWYGSRQAFPPQLAASQLWPAQGGDGSRGQVVTGLESHVAYLAGQLELPGDVDGDGWDDLVFVLPGGDAGALVNAGLAVVAYGRDPAGEAERSLADVLRGTSDDGLVVAGDVARGIDPALAVPVHGSGDVNGDGWFDWLLDRGSPYQGDGFLWRGADRRGRTTHLGNDTSDSLTGSSSADVLNGRQGPDVLAGHGGADVLLGGSGDDRLQLTDLAFRRVAGGGGSDTLVLELAQATLDLATLVGPRVGGIEVLELAGGLTQINVGSIAAAAFQEHDNRLFIRRSEQQVVHFTEPWGVVGAAVQGGRLFEIYQRNAMQVLVQDWGPEWQNPLQPLDVTHDGVVAPIDALRIVNELNEHTVSQLNGVLPSPLLTGVVPGWFWDVTGDGIVAPLDALRVINHLNGIASGEGEPTTAAAVPAAPLDPAAVAVVLAAAESEPTSFRQRLRGR